MRIERLIIQLRILINSNFHRYQHFPRKNKQQNQRSYKIHTKYIQSYFLIDQVYGKEHKTTEKYILYLYLYEPQDRVTTLNKPIIYHEQYSPPSCTAYCSLLLVDVPDGACMECWTDPPVYDKYYDVEWVQSQQFPTDTFEYISQFIILYGNNLTREQKPTNKNKNIRHIIPK